jgi:hypothetical protein
MEFDIEAWNECPQCRGSKIIRSRLSSVLTDICPTCGGRGGRDWVSHSMDRREAIDQKLLQNVVYENIQILAQMIREQGMRVGMTLNVRIEPVEHNHHYTMQSIGSHVHSAVGYESYPATLGPSKHHYDKK